MKIGFDHEKYLEEQSKYILERVNNYDKLYLEFGGKLLFDLHAKRVLPGFDENAKIKLLHSIEYPLYTVYNFHLKYRQNYPLSLSHKIYYIHL